TGYSTVATPDHRGWRGVHALLVAWNSSSDDSVRAMIDRRGVSLVMLCRGSGDLGVLTRGRDRATTFYGRLNADHIPSWLRPVALPPAAAAHVRVWEVEDRWTRMTRPASTAQSQPPK